MRKFLLAGVVALLGGHAALAQSPTMQFPTSPWGGYAPARIECGRLLSANMNTTSDQAIPISVPSATWMVSEIVVSNPSRSMTTAAGGFYSGASKSGVAVVASGQAYSALTTANANATGNAMVATIATAGNTTAFNTKVLYLSLTTGQGAAATADVRVFCRTLY